MLKKFFNAVMFIMTGRGELTRQAVNDGLVDLSDQGRDKYGN